MVVLIHVSWSQWLYWALLYFTLLINKKQLKQKTRLKILMCQEEKKPWIRQRETKCLKTKCPIENSYGFYLQHSCSFGIYLDWRIFVVVRLIKFYQSVTPLGMWTFVSGEQHANNTCPLHDLPILCSNVQ